MVALALLAFLLAGLLTGILAGLFGLGGGLVFVPLFYLSFPYLGVPQEVMMHLAVGTSLTAMIFSSAASARAHQKDGDILWPEVWKLAPFYALGALLAAIGTKWIPSHALHLLFVALLAYVILRALLKKGFTEEHPLSDYSPPGRPVMAGFGVFAGCLSALLGIAGSPITAPFLRNAKLPMVNTAAIAATLGAPIALFGCLGYLVTGWGKADLPPWTTGYIYWPAIPGIVIGAFCTIPLGTRLSHKLPDTLIARGYILLLCAVMVLMLL